MESTSLGEAKRLIVSCWKPVQSEIFSTSGESSVWIPKYRVLYTFSLSNKKSTTLFPCSSALLLTASLTAS